MPLDDKEFEELLRDLPQEDSFNQGLDEYKSTSDAYGHSLTINTGHVLFVPSEKVVGLSWSWPVAVTKNTGELHSADVPINKLYNEPDEPESGQVFSDEQIAAAINIAIEHGYELDPVVTAGLV